MVSMRYGHAEGSENKVRVGMCSCWIFSGGVA